MTAAPSLFFPLILPPEKGAPDPTAFYAGINSAIATADLPDGGIDITLSNPAVLHPAANFDTPLPVSTVVVPARGFLRYYPASSALPTPDGLPLALPPGLQSTDIGTLVLQLWPADRKRLAKAVPEATAPTHLALGGLERLSVEAALTGTVDQLSMKLLRRSWVDAGGTINSSSSPTTAALKAAFLQRLITGNAAIFVRAGAPLGTAALVESQPGVQNGWLRVAAFAVDANNVTTATAVDDLIDGIAADARGPTGAGILKDHPLDTGTDAPTNVQFTVKAMIWDRQIRQYVPFASQTIKLLDEKNVSLGVESTDANGEATFTASLRKRDLIAFEYDTKQKTIFNRYFPLPIKTLHYKAKTYIGSNDHSECFAKYFVDPFYSQFFDNLRSTSHTEKFNYDLGNAMKHHTPFASANEDERLKRLNEFETYYIKRPPSRPAFNVLFEGDSWFDYPFSDDIFYHLDKIFKEKVKKSFEYNVIALQHSGDRSDQMFKLLDNMGEGQWKYTQDIFSEYPIDLVIMSSGGNDFAEPGISKYDPSPYRDHWCLGDPGYFDLEAASHPLTGLGSDLPVAQRLVLASFAVLLKNHPWNRFLAGQQVLPINNQLVSKMLALGYDFGDNSDSLDEIANKIIDNFRPQINFPYNVTSPEDDFLDDVFDNVRIAQRYQEVKTNIETFLNMILPYAQIHGTKVIAHSYCYPLFRTTPTSLSGYNILPNLFPRYSSLTGPWFSNRFAEAGIVDKRVQRVALKSLIDAYVTFVLEEIKQSNAYGGMFDFADLRYMPNAKTTWRDSSHWRDEMHLRGDSFAALAWQIYAVAKSKFSSRLD